MDIFAINSRKMILFVWIYVCIWVLFSIAPNANTLSCFIKMNVTEKTHQEIFGPQNQKYPYAASINIIVFERTNTLLHSHTANVNNDHILVIHMMQGYNFFIFGINISYKRWGTIFV